MPLVQYPLLSGSNSAVECDLAKVEVAGSNPVSRSRFYAPFLWEGRLPMLILTSVLILIL